MSPPRSPRPRRKSTRRAPAQPRASRPRRPRSAAPSTAAPSTAAPSTAQPAAPRPRRATRTVDPRAIGAPPELAAEAAPETGAPRSVRRPAVSWYPGHMVKAQKRLALELRHIDAVLELRDARLPLLSGNPELLRLIGPRPRLLLLNKASLAEAAATRAWRALFDAEGIPAVALDAETGRGLNQIFPPLKRLTAPWAERYRRRGMRPPPLRLMVVGMPNVGKSTLINRIVHENRLKTAPMPGVTRGITWVPLRSDYLLMDTPGVMLPRIDDESAAQLLGWIGALPDAALGPEALALSLLARLLPLAAPALHRHYGLDPALPTDPHPWLDAFCIKRGFLLSGAQPERHRGAEAILQDFRAGRLGRYTLEAAPVPAASHGARPTPHTRGGADPQS